MQPSSAPCEEPGRDVSGLLASVDEAHAHVRELAPGQKGSLRVGVGVSATGTVARDEAYAVGMPGQ
jgi:hypothetical protein